ncbi:MAG: hypothetical protein MJ072_05505, partial [Clostridia bacterium]|nr:hypothetical protein [Clostridia bacterium]
YFCRLLLSLLTEEIGVKNRVSGFVKPVSVLREDGKFAELSIRILKADGIGDVSQHYHKLEDAFRYHGGIKYGKIGNADVQLCSAKIMKDVMKLILKRKGDREVLGDDQPLDKSLYEN